MENIKVGDVVELKSGSCEMTVENINDSKVVCIWYDDNEIKKREFEKGTLRKITDQDRKNMLPLI